MWIIYFGTIHCTQDQKYTLDITVDSTRTGNLCPLSTEDNTRMGDSNLLSTKDMQE